MPTKPLRPFAHFDFDLAAAVQSQLMAMLDALPVGPLTTKMLSRIDPEQGVYIIYLADKIMYIGTEVDSLPKRLGEHRKELINLKDVNARDLGFKCVIVPTNWMVYVDVKVFAAKYHWQGAGKQKKSSSRT